MWTPGVRAGWTLTSCACTLPAVQPSQSDAGPGMRVWPLPWAGARRWVKGSAVRPLGRGEAACRRVTFPLPTKRARPITRGTRLPACPEDGGRGLVGAPQPRAWPAKGSGWIPAGACTEGLGPLLRAAPCCRRQTWRTLRPDRSALKTRLRETQPGDAGPGLTGARAHRRAPWRPTGGALVTPRWAGLRLRSKLARKSTKTHTHL